MSIIYFDNAATTKVKKEVLNEMFPFFCEQYGNPSSIYGLGRKSKMAIEKARQRVAELIGANANEIYFTGCGSESDNTAIKGIAYANQSKGKHIITSKIEHHAILNSCEFLKKQGFEITYISVDEDGVINLQELINSIRKDTILISVMYANNEIGTIQPIQEIAKIAKEKNIIFHTDAVQAAGHIPINVKNTRIDMLSLSGHKIHAPKGIGALYVRKGIEFEKFINGGHQEKNKRAGTENVAGIVGIGKACEIAKNNMQRNIKYIGELREYYFKRIGEQFSKYKINGSRINRLPGNANVSFIGIDASELLMKLDNVGICASAGSACTSGDSNPSHVLAAIGLTPDLARSALRTTFDEENNKEEIDIAINEIYKICKNSNQY